MSNTSDTFDRCLSLLREHLSRALASECLEGLFREALRTAAVARELGFEDEGEDIRRVAGDAALEICSGLAPAEEAERRLRERLAVRLSLLGLALSPSPDGEV
jgi:hypothetical protein